MSKYGLAGWLSRFDFSFGKSWLKNPSGRILAELSAETRIRLAMEELGPTFMKLGQIMSTRPDLVGVQLADELQNLQTRVHADSPELVAQLIQEELGQPIEELFSEFSTEPVASASIGQVHRARLLSSDGKPGELVAVKVQHHDIKHRVHVDLDILTGLAQLAERLPELSPYRPCATVNEFQRALRRELDFQRELRNLEEFGRIFAANDAVTIAKPYPEVSTDRVLVMQWLEGTPLSDVQQIETRGVDLASIARNGAEMYLEMIFRHGVFHADPHPGNLLLMEDNTIGLLDFGMVGRIDEALREDIEDLLMAMVQQDSLQLGVTVRRVGSVPLGLNEASLRADLSDFVAHYANQPIDQFELAAA
ncbi:MAG: AarF/UbiB family protein, partial [Planctomycetales bacterium]